MPVCVYMLMCVCVRVCVMFRRVFVILCLCLCLCLWLVCCSSFRGYQRVQENITQGRGDFHEAVDLYSESPQAARGLLDIDSGEPSNFGFNQWPEHPVKFREVYELYVQDMRR
jgi:isopenicillin N synthase-like dioxygenase